MPDSIPLLCASRISKSFAGVHALRRVSFELRAGEVHALVGENGAGKSTLIKIITGALQPDEGTLKLGGQTVDHHDPVAARRRGIAAIYQQPALFPDLTVAENIALGMESGRFWRRVRWSQRRAKARELLSRLGAAIGPDRLAGELSMPQQQLVEIAKALAARARVVIMDEPTASLGEGEVARLHAVVGDLKAAGLGIIYISHRLDELFQVADRVTVLRDGAIVATRQVNELDRQALIRLMVGRELTAVFPKRTVPMGEPVLEVRGVHSHEARVRDIHLTVRAGEIVGLAGLVGAGRTELARVLFGLTAADGGQILVGGRPARIDSPQAATDHGIAYVPEDRRRHGVVSEFSLVHNITLAILRRISHRGRLDVGQERRLAAELARRLLVTAPSIDSPVANLSGGNQQKVAIARWLATEPRILILDEPTQGIDVGAKAEIHRLIVELAGRGLAIVLISSELPEILGMCDRIAVMRGGRIIGTLDRAAATQERLLALALGQQAA